MKKGILLILLFTGLFYSSAQSTGKYKIKFLQVNKENADCGLTILDNNKLVFTSAAEKVKASRKNYNPKRDLYIGDIDFDGEINNIKAVSKNKDSKFNKTGVAYTSDKRTIYFSVNKYVKKLSKQKLPKNQRLELFKATIDENGNTSNVEKLPFNQKEYSSGYPVLNSDNTKLYFVSDRLPSEGKTDIFVVDVHKDGTYSKPRNLGKNVNTSGNETTPFVGEDDILYFSSDGHPGKGNLDVFAVELYDKGTSESYQLAAPINSINDDFAYIVNKDNNQGYFTSNRLQGLGFNDLYAFILEKDVRPGECFIAVEGKVKDKETSEVISGANVDLYNLNGNLLESISTYDDGTYKFTVSCAKEYKLIASSDDYESKEQQIEILEENYHSTLHTNLNLTKIHKESVKRLQPIYYDFDDATITIVAAKEMDEIVKIMNDNPNLIIEASSFTDSRGSNTYNKALSQRRAKAAVNYLKSQGINTKRIKYKGYGEDKLVNQCVNGVECNEEAHQMNRRTEFNFASISSTSERKSEKKKGLVENIPKLKKEKLKKIELDKSISETTKINTDAEVRSAEIIDKKTKVDKDRLDVEKEKNITNSLAEVDKVKAKTEAEKTESVDIIKSDIKTIEAKPVKSNDKVIKEEVIVNYNSSIVATNKESNKALNYIESEKFKVIDKLFSLEKKYELAISNYPKVSDSLKIEREKLSKIIKLAETMEETGWSNIIEYKINLKRFSERYNELILGDNQKEKSDNLIISKKKKLTTPKKQQMISFI